VSVLYIFFSLARIACCVEGAWSVVSVIYCGYSVGEQWGHIGTEYIVGGVLVGRLILPHVKQSSWRSASSRDVGIGGLIRGMWIGDAGTVSGD
jgi:hypothetical protein